MARFWQIVTTVLGLILRHPITGVTMIPVLDDGSFVLVKRRDTGRWSLPGGIIDWGEDIPKAAARELKEETGLELVKMGRLVGVYSHPDRDPRMHSISIVLEVAAAGEFGVQDTLEIAQVQAFARQDLPLGALSHDHDRQLQDYLNGMITIA